LLKIFIKYDADDKMDRMVTCFTVHTIGAIHNVDLAYSIVAVHTMEQHTFKILTIV